MTCLICEKHKDFPVPTIKENEHAVLVHYQTSEDQPTMYKGHLFVEPKRHVESYADLSIEESRSVADLISFGSKGLKEKLEAEHIYIFTIMHQVAHLHFHLVPRYEGTPEKYWDRGLHDWPESPRLDHDGIVDLSKRLSDL